METNWDTQAGRALSSLARAIEQKGLVFEHPILVFGSAPLQIFIDPEFLSGDVDIALAGKTDLLKAIVEEIGCSKGTSSFYIEVVPEYVFRPGPNWKSRASVVLLGSVPFLFPDPVDILLGKLRRLDEKDIRAFKVVLNTTKHPTEGELLEELRASYDLFYFQMDGQKSPLWANTEKLWPILFGHPIDIKSEVLKPVLDVLESMNGPTDYLAQLRARLGMD